MSARPWNRSLPRALGLALWCAFAAALPGVDMRDLTLISPITGDPFPVVMVPPTQRGGDLLADMGADDDGCRHTSGMCEYDYYVATDPRSYFSALIAEWDDKSGRFRGELKPEIKAWVDKEFNSQLQIDINHSFQTATAIAKQRGAPPPDRKTFVLGQGDIPIERRYDYTYRCYLRRGARPAALAKVALMGVWSIRCRMNLIIANQSLSGGYQEVNDRIVRSIKDGERFVLAKWLPLYHDIFTSGKLTNEGYLVAGLTYFGMCLRDGDLKTSRDVLASLTERMKEVENGEVMRGLVRQRQTMLREYLGFLDKTARHFMEAIAAEEFTRLKLPETMLVVAESLRRGGEELRAMDWYLALAKMDETQPKWREEFRSQGKAPGPDAPFHVQIGWIADQAIARLTKSGLVHPGTIAGKDKDLLNAVVFEKLGSAEYANPGWKPVTGATQQDCALILDLIGKAAMEFNFRHNTWPKSLGELWERDVIHDRNYVNRFYCPVTGKPYLYTELPGDLSQTSPKTVLVTTSEPVSTNQGPRYGVFLANATMVWSAKPVKPGEIYAP
jgi:hypothetical protein